jgi:hypothetical protein
VHWWKQGYPLYIKICRYILASHGTHDSGPSLCRFHLWFGLGSQLHDLSLSLSLSRIWQYCWIHAVPSIMAIFNFLIILRNHSWSHPIASHNAEKANMNISRNIRVFNASCSSNAEMKGETSVFRYRDKCNIIPKYPFTLLFLYNHSIRVLKLFRKLIWNVHFIRVFSHWFHLHYFYTVQEIYRSKFSFIF